MKKCFLFLLLPIFIFASCDDDDDYSLDKFWVSLATVENPDNEPYFFLHLDDGSVLWIGATNFLNYRPATGQRILADYTLLSDTPEGSNYDHDAKLNDAYNILTKDIIDITPEMQDSIGNDPITVREMWIGSDYLNIRFAYKGFNKRHMLNLVSDSTKTYNDGKTHLEFRHNAFDDASTYTLTGWVSFDLATLQNNTSGNSLDLVIHVEESEGKEVTYEYTYKFNEDNNGSKTFDRDLFSEDKDVDVE